CGASLCSILPRWISIDGHFAVLRKIERSVKNYLYGEDVYKAQGFSPRIKKARKTSALEGRSQLYAHSFLAI
ncbi:MAG: hypothetical protein JXR96_24575, partial [Deltaproteobacteria bacterium]|nr:hypothetical protein [Deltaproteobacteria bacterium]